MIRVGKYKSFGEPYFANGPSKEALEQDAELYGALWSNWTTDVEKARKLPAGSIGKLIDGLPGNLQAVGGDLARLALDAKFVDALQTRINCVTASSRKASKTRRSTPSRRSNSMTTCSA